MPPIDGQTGEHRDARCLSRPDRAFMERSNMRKSLITGIAVAAAVLTFGAVAASATSGAHFFHKASKSTVNDSGALAVSWDEAGVGQQQVNYILTADASATYACINGGGNHPKAANKETFSGPLSSPETGFLPENGRVKGTLSVGPLSAGSFSCPSGQTLVLACVAYTNIVLTDTTNNITETFGNTSRVFLQGIC
jgi:hypothetical protein